MQKMTNAQKFRFVCIALLWLLLVYILVSSRPVTLWLLFIIAASAIVVFVPLYKRYMKK